MHQELQLIAFLDELEKINKKLNLISYKTRDELEIKHLQDSLSLLEAFDLEAGQRLLDIGAGGGFPGVPLAIMAPDAEFVLMDSTDKKMKAVEKIAKKVGIGLGLNFIWGNKGDTEESLRKNVELIKTYNTYDQIRTIRPVTPYPGCELYYEAMERGLLLGPEDFFEKFKNSDLLTVNFTDIPEEKFYKLLFEANKELINDHYIHTTKNMEEAAQFIQSFYNLYFKGETKFRGARHYDKK